MLAYGVFVFLSAEVPEVANELTVDWFDSRIAEIESEQAYLMSEMSRHRGCAPGSIILDDTPSLGLPPDDPAFIASVHPVPECRALQNQYADNGRQLRSLRSLRLGAGLETQQVRLQLEQMLRERERE